MNDFDPLVAHPTRHKGVYRIIEGHPEYAPGFYFIDEANILTGWFCTAELASTALTAHMFRLNDPSRAIGYPVTLLPSSQPQIDTARMIGPGIVEAREEVMRLEKLKEDAARSDQYRTWWQEEKARAEQMEKERDVWKSKFETQASGSAANNAAAKDWHAAADQMERERDAARADAELANKQREAAVNDLAVTAQSLSAGAAQLKERCERAEAELVEARKESAIACCDVCGFPYTVASTSGHHQCQNVNCPRVNDGEWRSEFALKPSADKALVLAKEVVALRKEHLETNKKLDHSIHMWANAWFRELGSYAIQKHHAIDAAVVSTQRVIARMRTAEAALADIDTALTGFARGEYIPKKGLEGVRQLFDTINLLLTRPHDSSQEESRLRKIIERDRHVYFGLVERVKKTLGQHEWLRLGRGSYVYDDNRWRDEFKTMFEGVMADVATMELVSRDMQGCPCSPEEVRAAKCEAAVILNKTVKPQGT